MPEKKYELRKDICYPGQYIRAGIQKTEREWKQLFPNLMNMNWEKEWFLDISPNLEPDDLHPRRVVNEIFEKSGLRSISYKEAAEEACRCYAKWLKILPANTFQHRIDQWMEETFPDGARLNRIERTMRFLEEAIELCQAMGLDPDRATAVMQYVYGRPIGEPSQEVGGVMVTLAALCNAAEDINMMQCAETELHRINQPDIKEKIQAKQVTKQVIGVAPEDLQNG